MPLQENGTLLLSFPYVCPEPVLAKLSFIYSTKNGQKSTGVVSRTCRVAGEEPRVRIEILIAGDVVRRGGVHLPFPYRKRSARETKTASVSSLFMLSLGLSRACLGKRPYLPLDRLTTSSLVEQTGGGEDGFRTPLGS